MRFSHSPLYFQLFWLVENQSLFQEKLIYNISVEATTVTSLLFILLKATQTICYVSHVLWLLWGIIFGNRWTLWFDKPFTSVFCRWIWKRFSLAELQKTLNVIPHSLVMNKLKECAVVAPSKKFFALIRHPKKKNSGAVPVHTFIYKFLKMGNSLQLKIHLQFHLFDRCNRNLRRNAS